jgi:hypothetical protein
LQIQSVVTARALDLLNSVSEDRSTRLENDPHASTAVKWIAAPLHEDDDLICKIRGAHIIGIVRWYVLGRWHLIQLLYYAEVNSRFLGSAPVSYSPYGTRVVRVHSHKVAVPSHLRPQLGMTLIPLPGSPETLVIGVRGPVAPRCNTAVDGPITLACLSNCN